MNRCATVTGASGFIGSTIVETLLKRDWRVHAIQHRRPLSPRLPSTPNLQQFTGDLFDAANLDRAMAGCDAVVHAVGIIFEHPSRGITFERIHVEGARAVCEAAKRNGVKRVIYLSAVGARPDAPSRYHQTKFGAELLIRDPAFEWTILRPSLVHGPKGDFMQLEAKMVRGKAAPFLFLPYFGGGLLGLGGAGRLQPIYVQDLAHAVVDVLDLAHGIGKTYQLGGAQIVTWPEMHRIASRAILGRERPVVPIPAWWASLLARVLPASVLGFNFDQVAMSREDNVADVSPFVADFHWQPKGFAETIAEYAKEL